MEVGGVGKSYQYTQRIKTLQTGFCRLIWKRKKRKKISAQKWNMYGCGCRIKVSVSGQVCREDLSNIFLIPAFKIIIGSI